jgi:putative transposase
LLAEGADGPEVARQLAVSEQTYYRWRNQFGGLKAHDAKRLRELERENATLKRLLAEAELVKAALKEIAKGERRRATPRACNPPDRPLMLTPVGRGHEAQ